MLARLTLRQFLLVTLGTLVAFFLLWFPYRAWWARSAWEITGSARLTHLLDPWNARLAFILGDAFFENHPPIYNLRQARYYYEKSAALDPGFAPAHFQLARIAFLEGDFTAAREHIARVRAIAADYPRIDYLEGLVLGYQGHILDAAEAFERFVAAYPATWAGYNDLAWLYFRIGLYDKVLDASARGLANAPDNAWLLNMHGLALLNLGRKSEAAGYFERARDAAAHMTARDWGVAYPGNDPTMYADGLERMREAIAHNLALASGEQGGGMPVSPGFSNAE